MNAEIWEGTSFAEYQAIDAVSRSALEDFLASPDLYHARHIDKRYPMEETAALKFGTDFHSVILDRAVVLVDNFKVPAEWREADPETIVEIPDSVLSKDGHRRGNPWKQFAAAHAGHTLLKPAEYESYRRWYDASRRDDVVLVSETDARHLEAMQDRILSHPEASKYVFSERKEIAVTWTCDETGVRRKARLDLVGNEIADLKTTPDATPAGFAASCERYGYHRQDAWYTDAWAEATGELKQFIFIAAQKKPAYTVACYRLCESWRERGRREVIRGLERLRNYDWSDVEYPQLLTIAEPRWAESQREYEVEA